MSYFFTVPYFLPKALILLHFLTLLHTEIRNNIISTNFQLKNTTPLIDHLHKLNTMLFR